VALLTSAFSAAAAVALLTTVLGKQVFDLTGSSLDLGLLGLAEFAPAALLVFLTGTLADRVDRRKLAGFGLGAQAIVIGGLAWYAGTRPTSTIPIFALVVGFGVTGAFATPATRALPADLVTPERLPWLVARETGTWQVASIFGPVAGGFLYVWNVRAPYVVDALLVVIAAIAIMLVHPASQHSDSDRPRAGMRDAIAGVRFVRSQPILLGAISLDLFAVLFGGAVALLPAIAENRLGVGAVGLGLLRAAIGIGAGSVTLYLAVRPVTRRVGRTLLVTVAVFGVGTIVLGATTSFAVAFVALVVLSGADSISIFIRSTLVPLVTPRDKRGRVLAVEAVFIGASNELGAFESGAMGDTAC
jgi:MFS family permease